MSWIVLNLKMAEDAGADLREDEVMFAITPASVAEVYNRYRNEVDEGHEEFRDRWQELTEGQRKDFLRVVERRIDRLLSNIDEDINDALEAAEEG